MLHINETDSETVFEVWVQPQSAKNEIKGFVGDVLRVKVTSPPIEGRANKACMGLLAKELGIGKSQVEIIGGYKSRTKTVRARGVTLGEIKRIVDGKKK